MRMLEDWLTSYMNFTENTEPPKQYNLWCGISCLAACLRRKVSIKKGFDTFYPNFYIVLVGKSAVRKGTAMKPARRLLEKTGIKFAGDAVTRERLIQELFNSISEFNVDQKIVYHSSLTVFSPELTVFLGYNNQQLMSNLVDWFDCSDVWENKTKNKGEESIRKVWLNLIAATTPELIRATLPRELIGGGLASRMMFIYADKKHKTIPDPSYSTELEQALLNDLEDVKQLSGTFIETNEFKKLYSAWYEKEDRNPSTGLKEVAEFDGYLGRRPSHFLKLCMIVNVSRKDGNMTLEAQDFFRAKTIIEETEQKMKFVFRGYGELDRGAALHNIMQTIAREGEITKNDLLKRHIWDVRDKDEFYKMLATLEYTGYCVIIDGFNEPSIVRYKENQDGNS